MSAECAVCRTPFDRVQEAQRFCTPRCRKRHELNLRKRDRVSITAGKVLNDQDLGRYYRALAADPCSYCQEPGGTRDHIVPTSRGGLDHWSNYTSACHACNAQKSSVSLLAYLGWKRTDNQVREAIAERLTWRNFGGPRRTRSAPAGVRPRRGAAFGVYGSGGSRGAAS
jgi:5-methylcytosine-specific restriction endonuclease McrA